MTTVQHFIITTKTYLMNNDYLLQGGILSRKTLSAENTEVWSKISTHSETDIKVAELIKVLYITHEISLTKFTFNLNYIKDCQYLKDRENDEGKMDFCNFVAPSLRAIYKNKALIPATFPDGFIAAFPDVVKWSMEDSSSQVLKQLNDKENSLPQFNKIEFNMEDLKTIVRCYSKSRVGTKWSFECKIFQPSMSFNSTLPEFLLYCTEHSKVLDITNLTPHTICSEGKEEKNVTSERIVLFFNKKMIRFSPVICGLLKSRMLVNIESVKQLEFEKVYSFSDRDSYTGLVIGSLSVSDQRIIVTHAFSGNQIIFENYDWNMRIE